MAIKSQQGQTVIEYILLLAVAVSLVVTLYNSNFFKKIFGEGGSLGAKVKAQSEFAYRHGYQSMEQDIPPGTRDITSHPTYSDLESGTTRFFGPKKNYP